MDSRRAAANTPIFTELRTAALPQTWPTGPLSVPNVPVSASSPLPSAFNAHSSDRRGSGLVQHVFRSPARPLFWVTTDVGSCAAPPNEKRCTLCYTEAMSDDVPDPFMHLSLPHFLCVAAIENVKAGLAFGLVIWLKEVRSSNGKHMNTANGIDWPRRYLLNL
jgi:hypothetical protein